MRDYKFKLIRKYDEDVLGYFARQDSKTWRISKTSKYLKEVLKRNYKYKKLLYNTRRKNLFFKKYKWLRLNGWYRKRWKKRRKFRKWANNKKKVMYNTSLFNIVGGLDFVYHLNTIFQKEVVKRKKRSLNRDIYFLRKKLKKFYSFKNFKGLNTLLYETKGHNYLGSSYVYLLEGRLEVVLYRANFFVSILAARQAITHLKVSVNGFVVNKPNYLLKLGDIITLNKTSSERLAMYNLLKSKFAKKSRTVFVNYPKYIEVNYKLLSIIFIKNPVSTEVPFPFLIDLELLKYRSIK